MRSLIEALNEHLQQEPEAVEVKTLHGWMDVVDIAAPIENLLNAILNAANAEALDDDDLAMSNQFVAGRSSMAKTILLIAARAEAEAEQ